MRGLIAVLACLLGGAALVVACDSSSYTYTGFGGASGFASSSSGGSATETSVPPGPCDTAIQGSSCLTTPLCETKEVANASCNDGLECVSGTFSPYFDRQEPKHASCATSCPTAYTTSAPGACAIPNADTLICEYDEGTCGCAPVGGIAPTADAGDADADAAIADAGAPNASDAGFDADAPVAYEWRCVKPATGCPRLRPAAGTRCVRPMSCDYGSCSFPDGVRMECSAGQWILERGCDGP